MKNIIEKLDLDNYIQNFQKFLARSKPVAMQGDIHQHYRYIQALGKIEFPAPAHVPHLENSLMRLKKQAVLSLEELYAFVVMVSYFNRLKVLELEEPLRSWIRGIEIPSEIMTTLAYFNDEGEINPQRDRELLSIQRAIKQNTIDIKESLYKLAHSSHLSLYLVDTQVHFQNGEETLLVRGGFNNALKATVVGRTSAGHFYIIPQSISHLKDKQSVLLSQHEEIIWRYCKEISAIFHKWERFLSYINREYDRFDHYQARIHFARAYDYEFILPSKGKEIKLSGFAHPAIENPVLIDIELDKKIMLVTGVNAGGKTMLLKSLLSSVYMSKYLLPFRCNASKTSIGHYKGIEAIIDDPQSIKNDISTFAGRMVEFSRLFSKDNTIVGVDEIELGTDSDEAASLFRVMLDELSQRDITFIVTTHHKRLASLMGIESSVELIAAIYDEANQRPTYRFLQGSIGKSYAFETAQRYGIPASIIQASKKVHGEDKERLNELIERSTTLERQMREKTMLLDASQKEIERKKIYLQNRRDELEEEHKAKIHALELQYNRAIKEAQEALRVKESSEGRRHLNKAHQIKSKSQNEPIEQEKIPLKEGDSIKYRSHKGELLSIRGESATIEVDGMKMRVGIKELKRFGNAPKPKPLSQKVDVRVEKSQAGVSIKLLGMFGDEAIEKVDKFISDALVNGLNEVQIIHGTGGGILSKLVSEYLKNHPKIQKFYKMPGNFGITIVEL
ncbi:MAG: DNA strand exchange inhibitor protein [Sulfurovum sp. FS08-3]|nr:MAG: DNA strand exchange inhibitor protein [Sulfurovum sp. FS08-3]